MTKARRLDEFGPDEGVQPAVGVPQQRPDDDPIDPATGDTDPEAGRRYVAELEGRFLAGLARLDAAAARRLPVALRECMHLLIKQGGLDIGSDALRLAAVTGVCQQAVAVSALAPEWFVKEGHEPLHDLPAEVVDAMVAGAAELAAAPRDHAVTAMYARSTPALLDGLIRFRGSPDDLAHHVAFGFIVSLTCGAGQALPSRRVARQLSAALPAPMRPVLN